MLAVAKRPDPANFRSAGFSGQELYPDFVDKAAVLVVRLAKNHPLPDGNKCAAWVSCACSSNGTPGAGIPTRSLTKQRGRAGTGRRRLAGGRRGSLVAAVPPPAGAWAYVSWVTRRVPGAGGLKAVGGGTVVHVVQNSVVRAPRKTHTPRSIAVNHGHLW
jgi:hypothetical protein